MRPTLNRLRHTRRLTWTADENKPIEEYFAIRGRQKYSNRFLMRMLARRYAYDSMFSIRSEHRVQVPFRDKMIFKF